MFISGLMYGAILFAASIFGRCVMCSYSVFSRRRSLFDGLIISSGFSYPFFSFKFFGISEYASCRACVSPKYQDSSSSMTMRVAAWKFSGFSVLLVSPAS